MESQTRAVEQHFTSSQPQVRAIYNRLLEIARRFGPVREEPKKTSIHLMNRTAFAGVSTRKDPAAPKPLRQAANGRFLIGTAVSSRQLDSPKLVALIAEQFDCLTAENEFKPASVHPRAGQFRFTAADKIVHFAREHRMKVVGHTLCSAKAFVFDEAARCPRPSASWSAAIGDFANRNWFWLMSYGNSCSTESP